MVQGLAFLSKKSWHTKNLANQEKVWIAEQRKAAEESKTKELARQIQQEREREELDRLAGKKTHLDRGIDWMYQGHAAAGGDGKPSELEQEDAAKRAEEFLLGKEYAPEGSAQGDFTQGSAGEGVNAVIKLEDGADSKPAAFAEASVADRNERFRQRVEDPMYMVSQKEREKKTEAQKQKDLYERVVGPVGRNHSDSESSSSSRFKKKSRRDRKRQKKERKRREKDSRKKRRHHHHYRSDDEDSERNRHRRYRESLSDVDSDGHDRRKRHHHKSHRYDSDDEEDHLHRERQHRRRRSRSRDKDERKYRKHRASSKSTHRRNGSRSRSPENSHYPKRDDCSRGGKDRHTYRESDNYHGERLQDKDPRSHHKHDNGPVKKAGYGLQGKSSMNSSEKLPPAELGPARGLLRKKRETVEDERRRARKRASSRRSMTAEERAQALHDMQTSAHARSHHNAYRSRSDHSDNLDEIPSRGKASFLKDLTEQTHGIKGSSHQSMASRMAQNRNTQQRMQDDSFL